MDGCPWLRNSVFYHILIDRFAGWVSPDRWNKPDFIGGTIQGVIKKLPYLQKLGVNGIWISPFYNTSAYHGYHITDFFSVDPRFGTLEDLKMLIKKAHNGGMKIIADFVPNHCSNQHPFFRNSQLDKNSEYMNWFYFTRWPNHYLQFLSVSELPKLNLDNKETENHIINAAIFWLNQGFDGFRLDHVIGPSHRFWKTFVDKIKAVFPNTVLLGEAWMMGVKWSELKTIFMQHKRFHWLCGPSSDSLFQEYVGLFDGVLDFRFQELIRSFVHSSAKDEIIFDVLEKRYRRFPADFVLPLFLDNHDMDRFLFSCGNNKNKLKHAIRIQFQLDQPCIIYYGSESGMSHECSVWDVQSHGDLQARMPMNWFSMDSDLFSFYQDMIKRKIRC